MPIEVRMPTLWDKHIVPRLVRLGCGTNSVEQQRRKLVPRASGRVLELGVGSGLNFAHYDPANVSEVIGVDPSEELLASARAAPRDAGLAVRLELGSAETLSLPDRSVDSVVVTYTLCSIPDLDRALGEVRRVLSEGGALYFCEHGLSPDAEVARWQRRLNPIWQRLTGGCQLTRPIPELLDNAGFNIELLDTMYLPGLRWMTYNSWGIARPI